MPSVGFEPAISAIERLQTYTLDRTAHSMFLFRKMNGFPPTLLEILCVGQKNYAKEARSSWIYCDTVLFR